MQKDKQIGSKVLTTLSNPLLKSAKHSTNGTIHVVKIPYFRMTIHIHIHLNGWRPVVAVFCNIFLVTLIIVLGDSIFWLFKVGVNVGITLISFCFEKDYSVCL